MSNQNSTDAIYFLESPGKLEKVPYEPYKSEQILHNLILQFPHLLVGDQIDPDDPPRWLLVKSEAGIPDAAMASNRWSADCILLDQNSIPTFVELKHSRNVSIRRTIIGQMLEYAANATVYWSAGRIRELAKEYCGGNEELNRRLRELFPILSSDDLDIDPEVYWKKVDENLRESKIRLLFVADELPAELKRIIEFLNDQMSDVEVLGVEVRQYSSASVHALVPRVIGQTELTRQKRIGAVKHKTSASAFLEACPDWSRALFEEIITGASEHDAIIGWGGKGFSVRAVRPTGQPVSVFYCYPPGVFDVENPFIDVYSKQLGETENIDELRAGLLAGGAFREAGQSTIRLLISQSTISAARQALPHLWNMCERIKGIGKQP